MIMNEQVLLQVSNNHSIPLSFFNRILERKEKQAPYFKSKGLVFLYFFFDNQSATLEA